MLDPFDYIKQFKKEHEESADIPDMPPTEGDKEKQEIGIKILTPSKLLNRLPVLLAQMKAENNSNKMINEIRQKLSLFHQQNEIAKKLCNNLIK